MNESKILRAAVDVYGSAAQTDMMIEEMSELIKALLKYRRGVNSATPYDLRKLRGSIIEEMADVGIMLDQMRLLYGDDSEHREKKLTRLALRLGLEAEEG